MNKKTPFQKPLKSYTWRNIKVGEMTEMVDV